MKAETPTNLNSHIELFLDLSTHLTNYSNHFRQVYASPGNDF